MRSGPSLILILILAALACGSVPPPPGAAAPAHTAPAASLPALPRSSIAAVLLHRDELGLDDEQVHELQELDEQLAEANAKLGEGPRRAAPDAGPPASATKGSGFSIGPGAGGGGHRGRGGGARRMSAPSSDRERPSMEQRIEDNDTRAYLRAEQVLTDAQREKARDFAEEYREQLYDRRHPEAAP